jgi:glycine/D-amino acid oxidase-like deaminating enzyme
MLAHLGPKGRVVTVREEGRIVGVAAWITTDGYPQPVATQLAQIPGTLRALYRRPKALIDGNRYLTAMAKAHIKTPHWYLLLARRRSRGSAPRRGQPSHE